MKQKIRAPDFLFLDEQYKHFNSYYKCDNWQWKKCAKIAIPYKFMCDTSHIAK